MQLPSESEISVAVSNKSGDLLNDTPTYLMAISASGDVHELVVSF